MEEELRELGYTSVQAIETENGVGYIAQNKNSGSAIIIPPNYKDAQGISLLVPGQDMHGSSLYYNAGVWRDKNKESNTYGQKFDYPNLSQQAKDGNWPSSTIVIAPNDLYPTMYNGVNNYDRDPSLEPGAKALNGAYNLLTANGADISNIGVLTFSNGGPGGMTSLGGFLQLNPDKQFNTKIFMADAYNINSKYTGVSLFDRKNLNANELAQVEQMQLLIKNKTEIIFSNWTSDKIYNHRNTEVVETCLLFSRLGFNAYCTDSSRTAHFSYVYDAIKGGAIDWLSGDANLALDDKYYGKYYRLDKNGNKIYLSNEESALLGLSFSNDAAVDYIHLKRLPVLKLGNVESLSLIRSSKQYVYFYMNQLRSVIRDSCLFDSSYPTINCEGVSELIQECIDKYYKTYGKMLDKLAKESSAIVSYADAYELMDTKQEQEAREL